MSQDLAGRTVAIAGAAGGLGPTVARRLAGAGARLALTDVDQARLDAVVTGLPGEHDARVVDLLDEQATRAWAESLGGVDAVAPPAGGGRGAHPIDQASLDDWRLLHDLLVRTLQHTSRAFAPALKASGHGRF